MTKCVVSNEATLGDHRGQVWRPFNWVRWLNYCPSGLQLSYAKASEAAKAAMAFFCVRKIFKWEC